MARKAAAARSKRAISPSDCQIKAGPSLHHTVHLQSDRLASAPLPPSLISLSCACSTTTSCCTLMSHMHGLYYIYHSSLSASCSSLRPLLSAPSALCSLYSLCSLLSALSLLSACSVLCFLCSLLPLLSAPSPFCSLPFLLPPLSAPSSVFSLVLTGEV